MSWKFPDAIVESGEVIGEEGLNDGFSPAASEAQGEINEHNLKAAINAPTSWGSPASSFISDDYVEASAVCLEYVNTRGSQADQRGATGGTSAATRGAWTVEDNQANHNQFADRPKWDGAVGINMSPTWTVIGGEEAPFQQASLTSPLPMSVSFFCSEETNIWVMASFMTSEGRQRFGSMFALRVNGAVITESVYGSGDRGNEPVFEEVTSTNRPAAETGHVSPSAGSFGNQIGYPVCLEAVITVPPGDTRIDVLAVTCEAINGGALDGQNGLYLVGEREIVILKMTR